MDVSELLEELRHVIKSDFTTTKRSLRLFEKFLADNHNSIVAMDMALQQRAQEVDSRQQNRKALQDIYLLMNPTKKKESVYSAAQVVEQVSQLCGRYRDLQGTVGELAKQVEGASANRGVMPGLCVAERALREAMHEALDSDKGGALWQELEDMDFTELVEKMKEEFEKFDHMYTRACYREQGLRRQLKSHKERSARRVRGLKEEVGRLESQLGEAKNDLIGVERMCRKLGGDLERAARVIEDQKSEVDRLKNNYNVSCALNRTLRAERDSAEERYNKQLGQLRLYLEKTHLTLDDDPGYKIIQEKGFEELLEWSASKTCALSGALLDIAQERDRVRARYLQDDNYQDGELADAAAVYAHGQPLFLPRGTAGAGGLRSIFPWPTNWLPNVKHEGNRRRQLVIAGQLIVAEIERLDRLAAKETNNSAEAPQFSIAKPPMLWARAMTHELNVFRWYASHSKTAGLWVPVGMHSVSSAASDLEVNLEQSDPVAFHTWSGGMYRTTGKAGVYVKAP